MTLNAFKSSTNPQTLLPNAPLGSDHVISDLKAYILKTAPANDIQNSELSLEQQVAALRDNLNPAPSTVTPGWMQASDETGSQIVPLLDLSPATGLIQDSLYPTEGGVSFDVSVNVKKVDSDTVRVTAGAGGAGEGWIDWFNFAGSASAELNIFSADSAETECDITITYKGVTKVTPLLGDSAYDAGHGTGWWAPGVIKQAVGNTPMTKSGYTFNKGKVPYNFGKDGNFGVVSNLVISQLPTFQLKYRTNNAQDYERMFSEKSDWKVGFLGITLASAHQSYYSSTYSYDSTSQTVTITMSPPQQSTSVPVLQQMAFVIGADVVWPAE